jgi:hypothetical protein
MNVTGGRITAGSFEGNGSLLSGVNSDSGSWVKDDTNGLIYVANSAHKVGIGTTDPVTPFELVVGTSAAPLTAETTVMQLNSTLDGSSSDHKCYFKFQYVPESNPVNWTDWSGRIQFVTDSTNQGYIEFNPPGAEYAIAFGNTGGGSAAGEIMRLLGTGNVGIGRNNPACALDIAGEDVMIRGNTPSLNFSEGTGAMDGAFRIRYDGANQVDNNNFLAIQTGTNFGITSLHCTYGGNVGIGITDPETALHVNGSITVGDIGANSVSHTDAQLILGGTHNQGYNRGNYIKLLISGGNNDGSSPYYIMCEDENSYDQFYVKGSTSNGGSGRMWVRGEVKMASSGDTYAFIPANDGWVRLQGGASGQGNMYGSYTSLAVGNFHAAGTTHYSDDRLKHFEEEIPNALELIQQLKPYKYKKTSKIYTEDYTGEIGEDWEWEIGLIAQDIEKIPYLEFAVSKPEDSPEKDKYGLNYTQFIGVCIQGIKKLDEELQTTRIELAETKTDLEERLNTHTHPLEPHTHPLEEHTHPLEPHTHPLEPHTHPLEPHTHPLEEHTHPDLVDQLTIEKAKTRELQQRLTLIEHSHAALVARLEALENI